jgi:hypothetical protein
LAQPKSTSSQPPSAHYVIGPSFTHSPLIHALEESAVRNDKDSLGAGTRMPFHFFLDETKLK